MKKLFSVFILLLISATVTPVVAKTQKHYKRLKIAVLPLQNLNGSNANNAIGLSMTANMYNALSKINYITVIERVRLNKIIEEQKLSLSGLIDHGVEVGRLSGANTLVLGSFEVRNNVLTFYIRMVDVASGRVILGVKKSGRINIANRLIQDCTQALIQQIGYPQKSTPRVKISWKQARKHVGQKVIVSGKVTDSYDTGKVCFLNFAKHGKKTFKVVIFAKDYHYFPANPAKLYYKKKLKITGIIKLYKNTPEIIIKRPEQIKIIK